MQKIFEIDKIKYTFEAQENMDIDFFLDKKEGDISYFKVAFDFGKRVVPEKISLSYRLPAVDVYNMWDPMTRVHYLGFGKIPTHSRLSGGMPIKQLISKSGKNRYLMTVSDVKSPVCISFGASERNGMMNFQIEFFTGITGPFEKYYENPQKSSIEKLLTKNEFF